MYTKGTTNLFLNPCAKNISTALSAQISSARDVPPAFLNTGFQGHLGGRGSLPTAHSTYQTEFGGLAGGTSQASFGTGNIASELPTLTHYRAAGNDFGKPLDFARHTAATDIFV